MTGLLIWLPVLRNEFDSRGETEGQREKDSEKEFFSFDTSED